MAPPRRKGEHSAMSPVRASALLLAAAANLAAVILAAAGRRRRSPAERARDDAEQARILATAPPVEPGRPPDARQ
jgi:hypothetical protein